MAIFSGLIVVCNGCGEAMRDMGEWPIMFPKEEKPNKNSQQAARYACRTCRIPHPTFAPGVPVQISIVDTGDT